MMRDKDAERILNQAAADCTNYVLENVSRWIYGHGRVAPPNYCAYDAFEAYRLVANALDRIRGFKVSPYA